MSILYFGLFALFVTIHGMKSLIATIRDDI